MSQTEVPVDIAWHSRVQDLPLRAQELLTFQVLVCLVLAHAAA